MIDSTWQKIQRNQLVSDQELALASDELKLAISIANKFQAGNSVTQYFNTCLYQIENIIFQRNLSKLEVPTNA